MNSNWSYSPETPNLGRIRRFLEPRDLEIWRMTFKNNWAPLLCYFNLYASFHHHMWIQTGVTVRKRFSRVLTSVTSTFDLWPRPFAWTSLLSLVITPENFIMIRRWDHSQKGMTDGQTDGRTDRRTDWTIHRAAWSQLKMRQMEYIQNWVVGERIVATNRIIGCWQPHSLSWLCWYTLTRIYKSACLWPLYEKYLCSNYFQYLSVHDPWIYRR